jgi:hemerythrin-like domain-containing protein
VLLTVSRARQCGPLAPAEAVSLRAALDYFRDAAPLQTTDEEGAAGALASLDALEADHQLSAAAHAEVDALGRAWLDAGSLAPESVRRMADLLRQPADTCRSHIGVEDTEVFPAAGRVLSPEQIAAVGREMENRRVRTRTER